MRGKSKLDVFKSNAKLLDAFAHYRRLILIDIIRENDILTFSELVRASKLKLSVVSFHLEKLIESGLVIKRKEDNTAWVSLDKKELKKAVSIISGI